MVRGKGSYYDREDREQDEVNEQKKERKMREKKTQVRRRKDADSLYKNEGKRERRILFQGRYEEAARWYPFFLSFLFTCRTSVSSLRRVCSLEGLPHQEKRSE